MKSHSGTMCWKPFGTFVTLRGNKKKRGVEPLFNLSKESREKRTSNLELKGRQRRFRVADSGSTEQRGKRLVRITKEGASKFGEKEGLVGGWRKMGENTTPTQQKAHLNLSDYRKAGYGPASEPEGQFRASNRQLKACLGWPGNGLRQIREKNETLFHEGKQSA